MQERKKAMESLLFLTEKEMAESREEQLQMVVYSVNGWKRKIQQVQQQHKNQYY